jgi:hypothetical protein
MFCTTGNVVVEEFSFALRAFLSSYPFSAHFILIAALLNMSMGHLTGISSWLTATDLNPGNY